MKTRFVSGIGAVFVAVMLWSPGTVHAFGGTLTIRYNSIHCDNLITGGTKQKVNDGAVSCVINIREVATQCQNPQKKSDTSNSHNFAVNTGEPIQLADDSSRWIFKNGKSPVELPFDQDTLKAALAEAGIFLDAATQCPNSNWHLVWAVTRFDLVATVNTVEVGYVPYFPNPVNAFASCNPEQSGLTYRKYDSSSGNVIDEDPSKGILDECWLFRDHKNLNDGIFTGQDRGGVVLVNGKLGQGSFYNGLCKDHGKQSGNLTNIGAYSPSGPSPNDSECTGGNQVLDGSY
jgi:hypothetical protein